MLFEMSERDYSIMAEHKNSDMWIQGYTDARETPVITDWRSDDINKLKGEDLEEYLKGYEAGMVELTRLVMLCGKRANYDKWQPTRRKIKRRKQ